VIEIKIKKINGGRKMCYYKYWKPGADRSSVGIVPVSLLLLRYLF